jgi:hypothetical protein
VESADKRTAEQLDQLEEESMVEDAKIVKKPKLLLS